MTNLKSRPYSRPSFNQTLSLQSEAAQRLIKQQLPPVVAALYNIDVVLRVMAEPQQMDEMDSLVSSMIESCRNELNQDIARMNQLRADHLISETPCYTNPATMEVSIISPQVRQIVSLIQQLDELVGCMDALWLCGVLSNQQKADGVYQSQRKIIRLGRRIMTLQKRAREGVRERRANKADDEAALL